MLLCKCGNQSKQQRHKLPTERQRVPNDSLWPSLGRLLRPLPNMLHVLQLVAPLLEGTACLR